MTAFTVAPADTQPAQYTATPMTATTSCLTLTVNVNSAYYKLTTGIGCAWDDFANCKASLHVVQFFYLWMARAADDIDLDGINATESYASVALLNRIDAALLADEGFDTSTAAGSEEALMVLLESWPVANADATEVKAADLASYEVRTAPGAAGTFERHITLGMLVPTDSGTPFRWWSKIMHLAKGTGRLIDRDEGAASVNPAYRDMVTGLFNSRMPQHTITSSFQVLPVVADLMTALENAPKGAMTARWISPMQAARDALFAKGLASTDADLRKKTIVSRLGLVINSCPALANVLGRVSGPNKSGALDLLFQSFELCGDASYLAAYPLMEAKLEEMNSLRSIGINEDPVKYIAAIAELDKRSKQRGSSSSASYGLSAGAAGGDGEDRGGFGGGAGVGFSAWDESKQAILGSKKVIDLCTKLEALGSTDYVKVIKTTFAAQVPMCAGMIVGHHKKAATLRPTLQKILHAKFFLKKYIHDVMASEGGANDQGVARTDLAEGNERYEVTDELERMVHDFKFDIPTILNETFALYEALGRSGASSASRLEVWIDEGKLELAAQMLQRVYSGMGGVGSPFQVWVRTARDTINLVSHMFSRESIADELSRTLLTDARDFTTMLRATIFNPEESYPPFNITLTAFEKVQEAFDSDALAKRTDSKQFQVMAVLKDCDPEAVRALLGGSAGGGKRKAAAEPEDTRLRNLATMGFNRTGTDQFVFSTGKLLVRTAIGNGSYIAYDKAGLTKKWRELTKQPPSVTPCWDVLTADLNGATARAKTAPVGTSKQSCHEPANWLSVRQDYRADSDFRPPARN